MIINYKEKYEEVLTNASIVHKLGNEEIKQVMENLFPELKESNDEKIRKALIKLIQHMENDELCCDYGHSKNDFLSWLEKQNKQEEPQVYATEDGEVITYSESEGYKVIDPKFKVNDIL